MVESILPNLYRLQIPLPENPLRAVNSYVIKGRNRNLIIDTGMNRQECLEAMRLGLHELEVDLAVTDLFITHLHADHSGLISRLATSESRVYCSRPDAAIINHSDYWHDMLAYAYRNGFPADDQAMYQHPGFKYGNRNPVDFTVVSEGDVVEAGGYSFRCVATPGHTRGHLCLYDETTGILVSGDHILGKITPNISVWTDEGNPLQEYLDSLDKVYWMDVQLVLPGHRQPITDHRERIDQLKIHHHKRAEAIIAVLRQGPQHAYEIASQLEWDLSYECWEQFPVPQKWFATGEVLAHLRYLEKEGMVKLDRSQTILRYCLA